MILKILAVILLGVSLCTAQAEEAVLIQLPDDLTVIEEEAFYGDVSIRSVIVPEGTTQIGSRAFAESGLEKIVLPNSLCFISDDAFEGCEGLEICVVDGSYAQEWAIGQGYLLPKPVCACDVSQAVAGDVLTWTVNAESDDFHFELYCDGAFIAEQKTAGIGSFVHMPDRAGEYVLRVTVKNGEAAATADAAPVIVSAAETAPASAFVYTINDGEVSITKYTGVETVVIVPQMIEGCPVVSVSLENNAKIERVVLPDTVTTIPAYAFYACYKLTDVNIPDGVRTIGVGAFYDCRRLKTVSFGKDVTEIGDVAFAECALLESTAFAGAGPVKVGEQAFLNCVRLRYFRFGLGFQGAEYEAFRNCTKLARIDFAQAACGAENVEIGNRAFCGCTIEEIELPEGVTVLKDYAFQECSKLQRMTLPASLVKIGNYAIVKYSDRPVLTVHEGSYAHEWCVEQERNFILVK